MKISIPMNKDSHTTWTPDSIELSRSEDDKGMLLIQLPDGRMIEVDFESVKKAINVL